MIEHDFGVGDSAREIGPFTDLRVEQSGIETELERRQGGKAFAERGIE